MKTPKSKLSNMKRFVLIRASDISGTSGTGVVAEGVQYTDGSVDLHWISQFKTREMLENIATVESIHGHDGATKVEWIDK